MRLIVGLGNPGPRYSGNRHNVGFLAADAIVRRFSFPAFSRKFSGEIAEGVVDGKKILLLKPLTFMNLSGQSVGECARFYKIPPEEICVIHDELDLPLGKLRVKQGGGNGGHNGLKSIDGHIGPDYWRVRLGIGHPGDKDLVSDYVLSDFSKEERKTVESWMEDIAASLSLLISGDAPGFMTRLAPAPPKAVGN